MRLAIAVLMGVSVLSSGTSFAQSGQGQASPAAPSVSVPRLINVNGIFRPADGQPIGRVETVTFAIYAEETGGTPLWQETQAVEPDSSGRYVVLLGATRPEGVPVDVFASGEARWLGMAWARGGESQARRSRLTFVPYAVRAADADTLGGRPASAYALASTPGTAAGSEVSDPAGAHEPTGYAILPGVPESLAKYANATDITPSVVYENGGRLGINTTVPGDMIHSRFTNTDGTLTGLAVQNMGNSGVSASGMLFYDQFNNVANFQGFNNLTHEYRINNVAKNGSNVFNGSINFMIGSTSRFFVGSNGNIGIGTTAPSALLEVSNALPGGPANVWTTSYTNFVGPYYLARRSRGTPGAPTAVQNGDGLSGLYGQGYGTTAFGPAFTGGMTVQAAQNWTDSAQGTALTFTTTSINSNTPATRMTLDATGNLGIGTSTPAALLEVNNGSSTNQTTSMIGVTFNSTSGAGTLISGRRYRGTPAAPTAVLSGDVLVNFRGTGYTGAGIGSGGANITIRADENWSTGAQGASMGFFTTPTGTTTTTEQMRLTPDGNLGIGTTNPTVELEIVRNGDALAVMKSYGAANGSAAGVFAGTARGSSQAPAATQSGDVLGIFLTAGHDGTDFGESGGMAVVAMENWTATAHGAATALIATPLGAVEQIPYVVVWHDGKVGVNMPVVNDVPTQAADTLQVFGNIRVGTSGTNGCLKDFGGTGIVGTCSSDVRLKKDITPFGAVLDRLTALRPVHYYWRASEFPEHHFGNNEAAGLIAQDVEKVLPELVETDKDGFKAVNYSKLPLFTIQAVKELRSENDALKQRVAELERRLTEVLAAIGRR